MCEGETEQREILIVSNWCIRFSITGDGISSESKEHHFIQDNINTLDRIARNQKSSFIGAPTAVSTRTATTTPTTTPEFDGDETPLPVMSPPAVAFPAVLRVRCNLHVRLDGRNGQNGQRIHVQIWGNDGDSVCFRKQWLTQNVDSIF